MTTPSGSASPVVATSSTPTPTATPTPSATSTYPPPASSTTSAPPPVTTAPPAVATPAPAATQLEVYNVSRRGGLAQSATNRLRGQGYVVTHVRNRIGYPLANTTVFYDPGNATAMAAADGVVARNLGVLAAAPRPANIPASGTLIVYVAASYR
ncbi:MAG TPA: LytR C-terminal domain-containing protein [Mycobacteriales bacterium]